MAQTIIGFRCNDFVMVASSGVTGHYYIKITDTDDSIAVLDSHKMLALAGERGDKTNFSEFIKCNLSLNRLKANDRGCSTPAAAHFISSTLAEALRKGPYSVNSMLAGFDKPLSAHDDEAAGAKLYYMDYLGTLVDVPFGAHGYGATFATAILDAEWRADLTAQQGVDLMQRLCTEVRKRVILSHDKFIVKVVTANGIEKIDTVA